MTKRRIVTTGEGLDLKIEIQEKRWFFWRSVFRRYVFPPFGEKDYEERFGGVQMVLEILERDGK